MSGVSDISGVADDVARIEERLHRNGGGLVPVIAQQWDSREILMVAWMDAEALRRTVVTGWATYWSRSRGEYWVKGATSGNFQRVRAVRVDCDGDAVVLEVDQQGPACHTGLTSCFDTFAVTVMPTEGDRP